MFEQSSNDFQTMIKPTVFVVLQLQGCVMRLKKHSGDIWNQCAVSVCLLAFTALENEFHCVLGICSVAGICLCFAFSDNLTLKPSSNHLQATFKPGSDQRTELTRTVRAQSAHSPRTVPAHSTSSHLFHALDCVWQQMFAEAKLAIDPPAILWFWQCWPHNLAKRCRCLDSVITHFAWLSQCKQNFAALQVSTHVCTCEHKHTEANAVQWRSFHTHGVVSNG